jgi:5-methylcytosine-specific restriction enzyme B
MIPETTRNSVLEATERFDKELRDSQEWKDWERQESHKYAIAHEGRRYPVKKIVSIATNTPVSSFSGGAEANGFIEKLGFQVVELRGPKPVGLSLQSLLERILSEYLRARSQGSFGGSHPVWQKFTDLKRAIEELPALDARPTLRVEWSVGKGNWARVPWVAIIDSREVGAPTGGVYFYQLSSYLRNFENRPVPDSLAEGILLYPTAGIELDQSYLLHNHRIRIKTIDLNQPWPLIEEAMFSLLKPVSD